MSVYSLATETCPWLSSIIDRSNKYGYPSERNGCFAANGPKRLSLSHQQQYCLSMQYGTCPFFPKPETERPIPPGSKSATKSFLPSGITLLLIVFLIVGLAFLASANLFTSGAVSAPPSQTPTANAIAFVFTPTTIPIVATLTASPTATAIPSTATLVPTVAAPTASPTAIAVVRTATLVPATPSITASPTKQPTVALRYPAVVLLEPRNEQQVNSETMTFEWQAAQLQTADHYELWLRRWGSPVWEKRFAIAGGKFVLTYRNAMDYGDYVWSILIADALGQNVSPIGEERKLAWRPHEIPGSQDSSSSSPFIKP